MPSGQLGRLARNESGLVAPLRATANATDELRPAKIRSVQLASALSDPFGLCRLNFRIEAGLACVGSPAGALAVGAGPNTLRHSGESCDWFRIMQAVMRSMSGISDPQRRNASPVQYCCCSAV